MNYSSSIFPSPTPAPESSDTSGSSAADDASNHVGFLVLIPVAVVLIVVVVVVGAYTRQTERRNDGRLCQLWRRISRRYSHHSDPSLNSTGRVSALRGGSTAMLVEELTDINTDIWDADCNCLTEELDQEPHQSSNNIPPSSASSSSGSDIGNYVCTVLVGVEVHSDPVVHQGMNDGENRLLVSSVHRTGSANLSLATDDEDVSTQMLDISSSNITSPSYYSARSTSPPSLASQNTVCSDDIPSSTSNASESESSDVLSAQEIVDVVHSKGFVMDTTAVLHSGSSQFSLFTESESRGYHTDTELSSSTPLRGRGGNAVTTSTAVGGDGGTEQQQQMIIPLSELDGRFGGAIMWEDWEQELHTML